MATVKYPTGNPEDIFDGRSMTIAELEQVLPLMVKHKNIVVSNTRLRDGLMVLHGNSFDKDVVVHVMPDELVLLDDWETKEKELLIVLRENNTYFMLSTPLVDILHEEGWTAKVLIADDVPMPDIRDLGDKSQVVTLQKFKDENEVLEAMKKACVFVATRLMKYDYDKDVVAAALHGCEVIYPSTSANVEMGVPGNMVPLCFDLEKVTKVVYAHVMFSIKGEKIPERKSSIVELTRSLRDAWEQSVDISRIERLAELLQ